MATENWQQSLKDSISTPEQLAEYFRLDPAPLRQVAERYPMRISPHYLRLIEQPGDPIWLQSVPDLRELDDAGLVDPLGEEDLSPVPAVIHRYPDRVIFLVSSSCATYCRFCTRKRKVGCRELSLSFKELRDGIDYIAATPEIRDVIFSGGDPLLLPDPVLADLLARVHAIPHVEMIRIGSRVPVTLPERITGKLCQILQRFAPIYLNTHFNHPRELTVESAAACSRLADAGIVLGNQTVLLRGVNDRPQIIADLFRGLLKMRVRPYYLHQMDLVRGGEHFRTSINTGLNIIKNLRGPVSGLANPYYVIDLPGGKGKVPLVPDDVVREGDRLLIRAASGELVEYSDKVD
ncbi:L-lysine 2,3-aminomutase [Malonomonas rubra DSM 5091]|uniref:L-lysine 2,3-aminomutase n=1 Tax=Malonomonas rubra DSM 5091 TaxID=1122189 RepID=A0A1M6JGW7_MALRU|nr:KamA family radical SAM protein [Malonomonas rubra]SHJ45959.1 L-lysine 2,3-aminomutase [Malonomonas rubra DSM 5091]